MKHYWVEKGTYICRWNRNSWWDMVTTKDAYYTDEDIINTGRQPAGSTRFNVPDQEYPMISVPTNRLKQICDQCGCSIEKSPYYRCLVCRGKIEP